MYTVSLRESRCINGRYDNTYCMLNHKHRVAFASFDDNCTQTRIISNTPSTWREKLCLVDGTKICFPQFSCIWHVLKFLVIIYSRVRYSRSHFFLLRLMYTSYFYINTFIPKTLCSSPFNIIYVIVLIALFASLRVEKLFVVHPESHSFFENA